MQFWLVRYDDEPANDTQHGEEPGTAGIAEGLETTILPRELDRAVERWDWSSGAIVPIVDGVLERIDCEHSDRHGPSAVDISRVRKAIEADLILAGIALPHSLVTAEAEALGVDPVERARVIVQKAAETNAAEVARIVDKAAAREQVK